MSNVYSIMLDMLSEADAPDYCEKMAEITNEVCNISLPPLSTTASQSAAIPQANVYDEDNNILNEDVCAKFKAECDTPTLPLFTVLQPTTSTIEGFLSNVRFHEKELIQELYPDEDIVIYRCNFDKIVYDGYVETTKVRTTNRGRKKKPKKKKRRKMQGNGTDFNSQITCVVRSTLGTSKVHKIKVFRTGKLQLPGVHQSAVEDAIICTQKVARIMNIHLHIGETDPAKMTRITNLNPVMKNYKFTVNLPTGHIIDLATLRTIFVRERQNNTTAARPAIFTIKYSRQDATKLSIKFDTPMRRRVNKRVRVNIFMRGRINILGAFHFDTTLIIYKYIHSIFEAHYNTIIVIEGDNDIHDPYLTTAQNIVPPDSEEIEYILAEARQNAFTDVEIYDEEYLEICSLANEEWLAQQNWDDWHIDEVRQLLE